MAQVRRVRATPAPDAPSGGAARDQYLFGMNSATSWTSVTQEVPTFVGSTSFANAWNVCAPGPVTATGRIVVLELLAHWLFDAAYAVGETPIPSTASMCVSLRCTPPFTITRIVPADGAVRVIELTTVGVDELLGKSTRATGALYSIPASPKILLAAIAAFALMWLFMMAPACRPITCPAIASGDVRLLILHRALDGVDLRLAVVDGSLDSGEVVVHLARLDHRTLRERIWQHDRAGVSSDWERHHGVCNRVCGEPVCDFHVHPRFEVDYDCGAQVASSQCDRSQM